MASSDDEGETVPSDVSEYDLNSKHGAVSLVELPVKWNDGNSALNGKLQQIFVRGKTDNGLRSLYKQVVAWKFDLSSKKPEISVLSVEGYWIKLLKPRKAFEVIIRTVLVTVHFLHFAKWYPLKPRKALWDHLSKTLSSFETRPSENDLVDHISLINEAVKRDGNLATSKLLVTFLAEKPKKRKVPDEDVKRPFIVDDVNDDQEVDKTDESEDDDEDDCYDSVCAICDNGGHIYLCEGKCMRSFHATPDDGEESNCASLGFTDEELEAIKNVDFYCKNCEYKQHQCFACGKLGSSDESSGAEVFCCVNGACGHFYHPACVAKLLHPGNQAAAEEHRQKIASGEQFACPVHRCHFCKEIEVKTTYELQFAVCRRCPRAYHRKCLPREIASEEDVVQGRAEIQRAWENLIPNRILIYCLKHEIDPSISTPVRNHIKFPGPQQKHERKLSLGSGKKELLKEGSFALEDIATKKISAKPSKGAEKLSSSSKKCDLFGKRMDILPTQTSFKKQKVALNRDSVEKTNESIAACNDHESVKSDRRERIRDEPGKTQEVKPMAKRIENSLTLDADSRRRILTLMKDASSSITLEDIKKKHEAPSTHAQYSKFAADNITLGKVEGAVQAVRAALKKLEEGGRIEDAKAVCGNDLLDQVMRKWKEKLKVYLAPFLHGMRYTSFGRHFTKYDKLKEVVDMLHWYVKDGDTIVDFCCGSNDFSCLMKEKLDEVRKECSFKNFDILQAKNDFNFERRDWMTVKRDELPEGSRLIMGLNPPFGVNGALANKFINKALEFKPKLLILIVPRETQRLDEKRSPYDLIWEDDQMCGGMSFYLPGSIDIYSRQIEDWNNSPPVVYLWSNPDWTSKHKAIAEQHGHLSGAKNKYKMEESHRPMHISNSSPDCRNLDESIANHEKEELRDEQETREPEFQETSNQKDDLPRDSCTEGDNKNHHKTKSDSEANPKAAFRGKRKRKRGSKKIFTDDKSSSRHAAPHHPIPNVSESSFLEPHYPPNHLERVPPHIPTPMDNYRLVDQGTLPTYHQDYHTPYQRSDNIDDLLQRYAPKNGGPHSSFTGRPAYGTGPSPDSGFRALADGWNPPSVFPNPQGLNPPANSYGPMSTPATLRYAPRLNDLTHNAGMNTFSGQPVTNTSSSYNPPTIPMTQHFGYAPGPHQPYPQHNNSSGGWIDG